MGQLSIEDVKTRILSLSDDIYIIPDDFEIRKEYLLGLTKKEFIQAFREYRNIMVEMYREAANHLHEYGYTKISRKTNQETLQNEFKSNLTYREKIIVLHHFINKLCEASALNEGTLEVNMPTFKELINTYPKIKYADKLIEKFIDYGFEFIGYNGKINKTNELNVTHVTNKNIIIVMKSFSMSKYSKLGMEFDYAHFNYKLLSILDNEQVDIKDLFVYNKLNEQSQSFLINFNEAMDEQGYSYGDCPTSGFCWGISQFAYSKNPEKKNKYVCRLYQRKNQLVVRLFLNNVKNYSDYIETTPDYIKDAFTNDFGKCDYCKDNCRHRKTYTIEDKLYEKCDGITFEFYCLDLSSINYYLELIKISNASTK